MYNYNNRDMARGILSISMAISILLMPAVFLVSLIYTEFLTALGLGLMAGPLSFMVFAVIMVFTIGGFFNE